MFYNAEFILYFFSVVIEIILLYLAYYNRRSFFFRMSTYVEEISQETRSSRFEDAYSRGYYLLLVKNLAWPLDCIMMCAATRTGHTFTYLFYHFNPTKTGIYRVTHWLGPMRIAQFLIPIHVYGLQCGSSRFSLRIFVAVIAK